MHAGLVTQERDGRGLIYRAAFEQMNAALGFLTENCCQACLVPGADSCRAMKRFQVHIHVDDVGASVAFCSKLFGAEPARAEPEHVKWMLEDPRVNLRFRRAARRPVSIIWVSRWTTQPSWTN